MDFETLLQDKYNFALKPQQRDAVLNTDGPAVLLAVPGSGKTTVIAARCAYLVLFCGIAAENILTLTFNRATQKDLELCYRKIFGLSAQGRLRFTTMHSICNLILREYGSLVNSKPPRLIEDGRQRLLRSLYMELNDGEYLPDDRLEELANTISSVKNRMLSGEQIEGSNVKTRNFPRIYAAYEQYKAANCYMDYDDMPIRAMAAFDDKPDLLERFRNQYRYINVDEAQDVSKLQHALIQRLAAPRNNLFMAGDTDQSIDFFKAASPEYLHDFSQVCPDARMLQMERNYRSTHAIVDAAARLIKHNSARHSLAMNTGNEIGMPVEETNLPDYNMLCGHIVSRLKSDGNCAGSAILFRENTTAVAVLDALDREGIPFTLREQKMSYFGHWVVRDILAFMALGHDAADINALKQIYYKLNTYISQATYTQAADLMAGGSGMDALDALLKCQNLSSNAAARVKKLKDNIAGLPGMEPASAVQYSVDKLGYGEYLKKVGGEGLYQESLLQIIESLKAIAARTNSYQELLERIAALAVLADNAQNSTDANAVTLATVHGSRGMEFQKVYIVDLFEGRFPSMAAVSAMSDGNKELLEEERRLFYVAVTRACKHVELVYSSKINGERVKPSRFVRELLPLAPIRKARPKNLNKQPVPGSPAKAPAERRPMARKPADFKPAAQKLGAFEQFNLVVGMDVAHKAFGQGVISAYDVKRDIVAVKFQKHEHGVKTFAAAFCVNGGVLKKPEAVCDEENKEPPV